MSNFASGAPFAFFALPALSSLADRAFCAALRVRVAVHPEGNAGMSLGCSWTAGSTPQDRWQVLASTCVLSV